jgi:hypothetical protein
MQAFASLLFLASVGGLVWLALRSPSMTVLLGGLALCLGLWIALAMIMRGPPPDSTEHWKKKEWWE